VQDELHSRDSKEQSMILKAVTLRITIKKGNEATGLAEQDDSPFFAKCLPISGVKKCISGDRPEL